MNEFKQYYVSDNCEHGCCYEASVKFKHNKKSEEQHICECHDKDTAEMICDALNRMEN